MYTMLASKGYVGIASSARVEVVEGLLSLLATQIPSVVGAEVMEDDKGLDGGATINISGMWTEACVTRRRVTRLSSSFIRMASSIL